MNLGIIAKMTSIERTPNDDVNSSNPLELHRHLAAAECDVEKSQTETSVEIARQFPTSYSSFEAVTAASVDKDQLVVAVSSNTSTSSASYVAENTDDGKSTASAVEKNMTGDTSSKTSMSSDLEKPDATVPTASLEADKITNPAMTSPKSSKYEAIFEDYLKFCAKYGLNPRNCDASWINVFISKTKSSLESDPNVLGEALSKIGDFHDKQVSS